MTGREKILAAFSPKGTPEIGVVSCYDSIFIRDHWYALTKTPWWYINSGIAEKESLWVRDFVEKSGLEWLALWPSPSRAERERCRIEERPDGVWRIDGATGQEIRLQEPTVSGVNTSCAGDHHKDLDSLPTTEKEIDALIPEASPFQRDAFLAEGRHDGAVALRNRFDLLLYSHIGSPVWSLYGYFGFEGLMTMVALRPDLVLYAARRILRHRIAHIHALAAMGMEAVWIEECCTDQISPKNFAAVNVPVLRECVDEIRRCGMKSIYYFCGNSMDRLDLLLSVGADGLHFEESKKGFVIELEQLVKKIQGRCTLFGNLDSIGVLQDGTEEALRSEVRRQITVGRQNGNRFVMSTGSPITPGTPVERVRLYTDLVREFGAGR